MPTTPSPPNQAPTTPPPNEAPTEPTGAPAMPATTMPADPTSANEARIEQFRTEIDQLKLKGANGQSERWLLVVGAVLAVVGVVLAIVGAVQVINAGGSPADQRAFMASGSLLGIVLVIAGSALFVRFSLGRYLRFWLIRLVYEGRADTDRIVDAIERASGLESTVAGPATMVTAPPSAAPPITPPVAPTAAPAAHATPPVAPAAPPAPPAPPTPSAG